MGYLAIKNFVLDMESPFLQQYCDQIWKPESQGTKWYHATERQHIFCHFL